MLCAKFHEGLTGYLQGYVAELLLTDPTMDFDNLVQKAHSYEVAHKARFSGSKQQGESTCHNGQNKPDSKPDAGNRSVRSTIQQ